MKNKADEIAASHNDAPERADDTLTRPPFPKKEEQRQTDEAIQNLRDIPMPLSSNDSKIKNKWIDGKSTNVWGI
jgi:hypothetical protein